MLQASTGAVSTGAASTGAVSTGAASTGAVSTGAASTGAVSTGSVSAGMASAGQYTPRHEGLCIYAEILSSDFRRRSSQHPTKRTVIKQFNA